jgi:hypothetical protein
MMVILVQSGDPGRKGTPPRLREDLRWLHQRATAADEFRATLGALGIAQRRVAQLFGVGPRSVRRWQCGDRRVPCGVGIVLRLLAAGAVTVAQVEQAAVPAPRAPGVSLLRQSRYREALLRTSSRHGLRGTPGAIVATYLAVSFLRETILTARKRGRRCCNLHELPAK